MLNRLVNLSTRTRYLILLLLDILIYAIASYRLPANYIIFALLIYLIISNKSKQLESFISYNDTDIFPKLFTAVVVSYILPAIFIKVSLQNIIYAILLVSAGLTSCRLIWKKLSEKPQAKDKVILIGAGVEGDLFMKNSYNVRVIAVLDDDVTKHGLTICGVKVLGGLELLSKICKQERVDKVILADSSLSDEKHQKLLKLTLELELPLVRVPSLESALQKETSSRIDITNLLEREEVKLSDDKLKEEISNKTLLVTGAGGTIGSQLCRQVLEYNPSKLILLGHGENSIDRIYKELRYNYPEVELVQVIADIRDYQRLLDVFRKYRPDIIYHAAAHKHVPLMEENPKEAFNNNVLGTYNVIKAVDATKVSKMVMISTDKAVRPTSVMGATKRICELMVSAFSKKSDSVYCSVRFGNILGSSGSVLCVFNEQLRRKEPLTVTDLRMKRYFMTVQEASRLVIYAGAFARDGEIFALDMGEAISIYDLAKNLILLNGQKIEDVGIIETGIRPGEKLDEEILTEEEITGQKLNDKIFIGKLKEVSLSELEGFIEEVKDLPEEEVKERIIEYANSTFEKVE